jgi:hypothetical protein
MNRTMRLTLSAAFVVGLSFIATAAYAQSPFDGTWKLNAAQSKFDPKPFTVYTSGGWWHCVSCTPPFDVAADGQDHAVTGQPTFDTANATIVDAKTEKLVLKKGGKLSLEQTAAVSADGKTLTLTNTGYPPNGGDPTHETDILKRVGVLPAGVHATSGNWQAVKFTGSDNELLFTFKSDGDQFSMTDPTGDSYTAKFDGNDYPYKGSNGTDAVTLKKIDAHTIVETDKLAGKVVNVSKMTVSANGKSITIEAHDPQRDTTSTFVATKK